VKIAALRIAMVSEHASPLAALGGVDAGGQNVHVAALAAALAARGHDVVVHTRRDDPGLPEVLHVVAGYAVHHLDAGPAEPVPKDALLPYVPAMAAGLRAAWTEARPDLVHAHFWMSGLAAVRAAPARAPVVQTFHALGWVKRRHQGLRDTSPRARHRLEPELARRVDHVVATASDERRELVRHGVAAERISVVPCGVDLDAFIPVGPVAVRGSHPRLLMVNRLVERKGVETAVRALAGVPDAELVVAGGPPAADLDADPEARRLRAVAAEVGVDDRLVLLGAVARTDVAPLLRSADAVVCTPWYEPFGIVPLEAMACARPVVATAVGGLVDTVVHASTGLLVPAQDPGALAAALRRILHHAAAARTMGRRGRARVEERYGWAQVAAATEAAYARALAPAAAAAHAPAAVSR
jgi:glycosyltransferase involved in cell wall biosynthesis